MPKKTKKTIKVKFAVYIRNGGDGSASAQFFRDAELAEQAAERDDERFGDDVESHELVIDLETGEIVSGIETEVPDDD